jgi:hypothetical protein
MRVHSHHCPCMRMHAPVNLGRSVLLGQHLTTRMEASNASSGRCWNTRGGEFVSLERGREKLCRSPCMRHLVIALDSPCMRHLVVYFPVPMHEAGSRPHSYSVSNWPAVSCPEDVNRFSRWHFGSRQMAPCPRCCYQQDAGLHSSRRAT